MKFLKIFVFISICINVSAQEATYTIKDELIFYSDVMVNGAKVENRLRAGNNFFNLFDNYIQKNNDLSFLEFISVLEPLDKAFKLISWQVEADKYNYEYFAYILFPDGAVHRLEHTNSLIKELQNEVLELSDWYGAWYYNIKKIGDDYLIFGYDANSEFTNQKVVDVINLGPEITLGKPIFADKEDPEFFRNRLMISFSADASVNLNYNPGLEMIVHDHLMQRMGRLPGQGPTNIPDGTYEGYQFENGKWKYIEKMFNHSYGNNNAPRPKPILDTKRGDSKKKKK